MAIKLNLAKTDRVLFCGSKWWGDPDMINLLQLDENDEIGMRFYDCGMVNLMMKESDLKFGNWKKTKAYLHSL